MQTRCCEQDLLQSIAASEVTQSSFREQEERSACWDDRECVHPRVARGARPPRPEDGAGQGQPALGRDPLFLPVPDIAWFCSGVETVAHAQAPPGTCLGT